MTRLCILVVEDDVPIRRGIVHTLRFHGYEVREAGSRSSGAACLEEGEIDLLLLDLNLPDGDGLDLLRELRSHRVELPVIILTARGEEAERVQGLRLGADDYMVKPFGALELAARVEAVLRRSPARPTPARQLDLGGVRIDMGTREVQVEGLPARHLTERECELLSFLVAHPERAVTRDEILAQVWRLNPDAVETRTIDMTVARLREKLGDDGAQPRLIQTLRGRGYRFTGQLP
mgnify:CR=1 FL=1